MRLRNLLRPLVLLGAGALLHAACQNGTAKSEAAPAGRSGELGEVLARIDDVNITVNEFQERINKQSPYVRARYTSLERKKEFLDNLVRFEVLAKEAKSRGLDRDDEVVRTMKQVMIQRLMSDEFNKLKLEDISDDECKKYFETHPEEFNKPEEVRVAHLQVKDEKTAQRVLADPRIKGQDGEEFRKLVAEFSQDAETRERGGDLRYFTADEKALPQEIVKAGFALQNLGDVTAKPVRVGANLHIVKLTGRRKALLRTLDEVKAQIRNRLFRDARQAKMEAFIQALRQKSKVEVHEERLAKVVIETGGPGMEGPGVSPPGPGEFHPGAPGAPQNTPQLPGTPPAAINIQPPPPAAPAPK